MSHKVYTVGRDRNADIRLDDPSVSRFHAELVLGSDGTIFLADRSSSGGTYLHCDGEWEPLHSAQLQPGDQIRLANLEVIVSDLLGRSTASSQQPQPRLPSGRVKRDPISGEVIPD